MNPSYIFTLSSFLELSIFDCRAILQLELDLHLITTCTEIDFSGSKHGRDITSSPFQPVLLQHLRRHPADRASDVFHRSVALLALRARGSSSPRPSPANSCPNPSTPWQSASPCNSEAHSNKSTTEQRLHETHQSGGRALPCTGATGSAGSSSQLGRLVCCFGVGLRQ